jgi:hypothetical protein
MSDGVRAYEVDAKTAEALWKKSEELVAEFLILFIPDNERLQEERND